MYKNKMKFIIWCWDYHKFVGGCRIMHKLCHLLNEMGEEAYVTAKVTNPEWNTPIYDGSGFDKENTIVIYPECFNDNFLDAKYVVRWLLFHQICEYNPSDYIFKLHGCYRSANDKYDGLLEVFDYDLSSWKNLEIPRTNEMVAFRKGIWKKDSLKLNFENYLIYDDLEKLEDEDLLCRVMNSCKNFVCLDESSFIPIQSVLCGCATMVVPFPGLNAKQYRSIFPAMQYGVAYGDTPYEINRAKLTKHLVRDHITKINDSSIDSARKFVEFWKNELNES